MGETPDAEGGEHREASRRKRARTTRSPIGTSGACTVIPTRRSRNQTPAANLGAARIETRASRP